jgi:hypothetical protein
MFANNLMKVGGSSRFIILLIFYIPCLVSDVILYIKDQLHITPNITYTLLILELVLIIAYFVLPRYYGMPLMNGGIELHKGKMFLDTKQILTLADYTSIISNTDINVNEPSRKRYSISLWLYVNAPEMSNTIFPIICYGNAETSGKPLMTYGYDKEMNTFVLNVSFSNSTSSSVKIVVPNQKWNNLVFNYTGPISDLFVNGTLEKSFNMSNNMPVFSVSDAITVGSNTKGINGAISNVFYYTQPLSALQILGFYRLGIVL